MRADKVLKSLLAAAAKKSKNNAYFVCHHILYPVSGTPHVTVLEITDGTTKSWL